MTIKAVVRFIIGSMPAKVLLVTAPFMAAAFMMDDPQAIKARPGMLMVTAFMILWIAGQLLSMWANSPDKGEEK